MSLVVAMAVIGGIENFVAAAVGAIFLQVMLEFLRTSFEIGGIHVDMTVWRLVFFGLLLMVTLRFFRNGLIAPLITRFQREGVAAETVAKRAAAAPAMPGRRVRAAHDLASRSPTCTNASAATMC